MKVGVIGLGNMGTGLSKRLKALNVDLIFYNRTLDKAKNLAATLNAQYAESVEEVTKANPDYIAIFVSDDIAFLPLFTSSKGLLNCTPETTIVNMATITPSTSQIANEMLKERGIQYLESPVMGSGPDFETGSQVVFLGGTKELAEKSTEFIKLFASKWYYVGEVPKAMVLKLAANGLWVGFAPLLGEVVATLEAWNIPKETIKEITNGTWLEFGIDRVWKRAFDKEVTPPRFKGRLAGKDMRYLAEAASIKGLPQHIFNSMAKVYEEAAIQGYADRDYPLVMRYLVEQAQKVKHTQPL